MSKYTLMGKLVLDGDFRDDAFGDPATAGAKPEQDLMKYLLTLSPVELKKIRDCMATIEKICCQKWPCP